MPSPTRQQLAAAIRQDRDYWRALRDEVGRDRMEEPGPMGDWTFRDLVGHLAGWRNWRIAQLEAAARGETAPLPPWPAELDDDDVINDWLHEQDRERSLDDLLADYDGSFERLASAIEALPDEALTDPDYLPWTGGEALIDADFTSHLHEEHAPGVREWLATR